MLVFIEEATSMKPYIFANSRKFQIRRASMTEAERLGSADVL